MMPSSDNLLTKDPFRLSSQPNLTPLYYNLLHTNQPSTTSGNMPLVSQPPNTSAGHRAQTFTGQHTISSGPNTGIPPGERLTENKFKTTKPEKVHKEINNWSENHQLFFRQFQSKPFNVESTGRFYSALISFQVGIKVVSLFVRLLRFSRFGIDVKRVDRE